MAAPQLRLEVSLNLAGFRTEIQKLTNIAQSEFAPKINVKFNRRTLDTELNNLQAAIKRRVYRVEIGGNIETLPNQIRDLKKELASLESFKIDLGIGAVKSLSKKDASKIKSNLRTEILGQQKKIYVGVSIKPSIARQDVRDFKNAVQSQLTGISVKVKADLEAASISSGAKSRSDIETDVRRGLEAISEIGAQRMAGAGGGVTEAARREQLRQSLTTGGFDIGGLKDIGKQLGVAKVGLFKDANNLINKIVTDASIEMVKKYLDPQAVMRNSDRSGLGKVLDTFARGVFNMLGMDPASIRAQQQSSRQKAFTPAGLLPSFTSKGAREEMMRQLTGGISPSASGGGGRDGKLALTNASNMEVQSVKVREIFDPREFEFATLRLFRVIGDALESASNQAKNARIDQSVDALMQSIDNAIKVGQARVRNVSSLLSGKVDVRDLGRSNLLKGVSPAGLLPPAAGRAPSPYSTTQDFFARRTEEAQSRSRQRALAVSSETGLRLPGTTFMGDAFTYGGGLDRVTGTGQPPQRGGAMVRHPGGPQLGPATRLPSDYFDKGSTTDKYRQGLKLAADATDSFRAGQIPFLSGLKSIAGEFGEATKQVLLYGTAYKGLAFITSLPGQILNAANSQQQFSNAMQVATQTSGSYAKELLFVDNVQRAFGLDLGTTRSGFTRLYASMSPAGFDSGSIEKLFVGISSAMASLQLTPDKAERVIYAFGQMASKGQVMSEELKGQLGDVLPGALAIFASAAGKSLKEFNKEIEDGVYSGAKFRDLMSKVTEELITRFGSGAAAAGRSLQGLMNIVKGDFTRLLESFAPLANSAAEAILKPLGGALRQLSVATKLATGERGRLGGQVVKQEKVVQELGSVAAVERGGPNEAKALEQYKGAKQSLAALNIELENLNELAKDPAIAQQAKDIKAFTDEIGKAATFVKNFATAVGGVLSPVLNFLGTNLTSVIATVATLVFTFQGARLALVAFAGVMTVIKGIVAAVGLLALVQQVGSFSAALAVNGTIGKQVAAMYTALGVTAKFAGGQIVFASGATLSFRAAVIALMSATGLGLLIAVLGTVGAAFLTMGDNAKQAAEDAKQAAKDMAEAARTGNVPQVEAVIRQASADSQLIADAQNIVRQRSTKKQGIYGAAATPTLSEGDLSEAEKNTLAAAGISLPRRGAARRELLKQLNDLLAEKKSILQKGKSQLEIAEKQKERTGQAIPDLGLQGTEKAEDPNAEKAAQRGQALLNAIEQREEAIAKAREQREDDIAKVRKDAIERAQKLEETFAKQRLDVERKVAQARRDLAAAREDIDFSSRLRTAGLTGGDTGAIEAEQRAAQAGRVRDEEKRQVEQQILDDQIDRAKQIEKLKKETADGINEANTRYTKTIGEAQKGYARSVAKIIEEGSEKAGQRLAKAAQMVSLYMQRGTQNNMIAGATGFVIPERTNGVYNFGAQGGRSREEVKTDPTFRDLPTSVNNLLRIDDKLDQLRKDLNMSRKPDIGQQFTAMLGAEGGFEDIAMTRGQAAIIIKKLETEALSRNISSDAFVNALDQIGRFAASPDESRRSIRNLMATPGAGIAVRSPGLLRNLATKQLGQDRTNIQAEGVNPASLKKQIEPMLAIISQLQKDNLLRKDVSLGETREQIQKPLYGALMDWLKANLNNAELQKILKSTGFGQGIMESYGAKGILPRAAGFKPENFGVNLTPSALKEQREYEERQRYEATPAGKAEEAREQEYARRFREALEERRKAQRSEVITPESFDVSKVATDFGTIAAASILRGVLDTSRIPELSRSAQVAQVQQLPTVPFPQQVDRPNASTTTQLQNTAGEVDRLGTSLKNVSGKLSDTNFFKTYTDELERATQSLAGARKQAEDDVDKLNRVLSLRRGGLTGDQAERLDEANELSRKALKDATTEYQSKLKEAEGDPELQQQITDEFNNTAKEIEQSYVNLLQFNEALNNMPVELGLTFAIQDIKDKLKDLLDPVNQIKGAAGAVGDAFGEAFKGVITGSMTAQEALAGFFQNIANYFADMVAQMIAEWLKAQLIQGFQSLFSAVLPGLGAAAGGLSSGFSAGTSSAIDTGAAGWASSFATPLKFANGGIASGGFQAFANGGIVSGPTLGLVGEGRYNEAVIPLPDGKSVPVDLGGMAGGMGGEVTSNIVVNINNGQMQGNGNSNGSELGRKIEGAVKQVLVSELRPGGILSSGRR